MTKISIPQTRWNPATYLVIGASLTFAVWDGATAADWKFTAGVGATETYTDNVTLSASGARNSDFVTSITPTISAKKDGARLKVDARYSMQNLFYARESERNTIFHQLSARANAALYERELFLDTSAAISQASVSPLSASGTDNINSTNNLANVRTISVSPYWMHRFGSTATLNARYTASRVSNYTNEFSGSTNNTYSAGLASGSAFGRVSWGLNFLQQNADYEDRSNVRLSSTSASLGYLVSPRLRLTGTFGTESNQFATATGSAPSETFWNTSVAWAPSSRTSFDLGFGRRFYGNTWNFAFRTRGPHSTWTADYTESLQTSNNQLATSGAAATVAQRQVTDIFLFNRTTLTNQVFLSKRFATAFAWNKGKSEFRLEAFHSSQTTQIDQDTNTVSQSLVTGNTANSNDIFLLTNDFKQVGVSGIWNRKLTALISSNVTLGVTRNTFSGLNRTDTTSSVQVGLNRQFSSNLNGSLSLRHQNRDSDQSNADFSESSLSGTVNYNF